MNGERPEVRCPQNHTAGHRNTSLSFPAASGTRKVFPTELEWGQLVLTVHETVVCFSPT